MSNAQASNSKILIIKLGALGDVVQSLGPMAAIRAHHQNAHITLLTTAPFEELLSKAAVADDIWIDDRPSGFDLSGWLALRRKLRLGGFDLIYDLQTSGRSSRYFKLFWPGPYPEWSGIAKGCSHPHSNPHRDNMHTLERQKEQLEMAGINDVDAPSLDAIQGDVSHLELPEKYCVIVPGGAEHRPEKRWPIDHYRDLIKRLDTEGVSAVVCGTEAEESLAASIVADRANAMNIAGKTSIVDLVGVMRGASFAIGNDSGPMHIAAALGVPSVVLYSHASDPALCAQRGPDVTILREPSLSELSVDEVYQKLPVGGGS